MEAMVIEGLISGAKAIYSAVRKAIEASQLDDAKKQEYLDQLDASIAAKEAKLDSMEVITKP
jgi:hypothetical protein